MQSVGLILNDMKANTRNQISNINDVENNSCILVVLSECTKTKSLVLHF